MEISRIHFINVQMWIKCNSPFLPTLLQHPLRSLFDCLNDKPLLFTIHSHLSLYSIFQSICYRTIAEEVQFTLCFPSVIKRGANYVNSDIMANIKCFCGTSVGKRRCGPTALEQVAWLRLGPGFAPSRDLHQVRICQSVLEINRTFSGYLQIWIYFLEHTKDHILTTEYGEHSSYV